MTGNVLTLSALNSTSITNQNVSQLNATISGTGQNLTVSSSRSVKAGDITLSGGTLNVTLTGGNLTRSGIIKTGTNGSAILNVSQGSILGNGLIDSNSLNFAAIVAPDLSVANATFTRLSANVTQSGNINLSRGSNLTIDQAITSFGDITFALSAGDLTINGPLTAGGNGNIALTATTGALNTTANATSSITGNVLTVTTQNDLVLQTDVNELIANVTGNPGNITVTEKNGLIVGSGNINAANTIAITLLAGDLTRTGAINTSTATGNVTLNIVAGGVTGNGAINAATLSWTSKSTAAINDAFLTYSNVAANVTGAGNDIFISRTGDFTVLNATTTDGNIGVTSTVGVITTGNLAINGPITAGGGKAVTLSAVGGNVTSSNSAAVINTTGNVSLVAQNSSSIYTNIAGLAANVTAGDLSVVEANGLTLLGGAGNNVTASGNVSIRVGNSVAGNLSGSGYLNAGGNVTITAPNGAVTLTSVVGQINGGNLSITANGASAANTNVTNLTANIAAGGLTIVDVDSLTIEPTDVVATGAVAITSTGGDIYGSANGGINTSGDVTLSALNGAVLFTNNANQITGNVLTINAESDSAVNTAVSSLVANITAGKLTVVEANNLAVGTTAGTAVVTTGDLTINLANGSLTGVGSINAGAGDVTINVSQGGITLNSSASQVRGDVLTIDSASNAVNVNTAVNAVVANLTGEGNGIVVSQTGNLAINGGDITTTNGSIAIATTGNLTRTNNIDAGTANVTLTAGGAITGSGLISGNVLAVTAATATTLNTAINGVTATLSTNLASLTITEADDLDLVLAGINTNNGIVNVSLTGNLGGAGSINAGTGNVTINTTSGGINLSNVSQVVRGGVLNVVAQTEASLVTNVAELTATIAGIGEGLTIREANGLAINSANIVTTDGLIDIATTTGNINGTGVINAGTGDVVLNAVAGNVNLALAANQVSGANLTVVAQTASSLNTHVDDLNAVISTGGLTVVDYDDLSIDLGNVTAGGVISLTAGNASTAADLTGNGTIAAANGAANIALTADGGKIVFNATGGQIVGSVLTVNAKDDASVNTQVANLVANVTAGGLNVTDVDSLNIGTSATSNVIASGDISISLDSGSLAGSGTINAGAGASNVSLTLGTGNVVLNSAANQVVGNVLNVTATSGAVNLNSAVNTVTVQTNDFGVAINQSQALTVNSIVADGNVNIALSAGDLQIDSGSILGAQLSNITLNVANGAINSVDLGLVGNFGVVFGNVLDIRAANSSDINTTVTTLTANITGDAQSLTVTDGDDPTDSVADGLTIGAAGVLTKGGDVTLNVMTVDNGGNVATDVANLVGSGNISTLNTTNNVAGNITLNVANGAANFTARAGQVTGNVLMLSVVNNSTINTNVTTLDQFNAPTGNAISGQNQILTINEVNNLEIGPGNIVATNGSDLVINVGGNLTVTATGGALIADDGTTKGNITLNASAGSIGSSGAELNVTANVLNINRAQNDVYVNTTVDLLNANVTNGQLTIVQPGDLTIGAIAANGVAISAGGAINGTGSNLTSYINSANGNGNVTLVADNITLTATNQVVGNVLNVTVVNTSSLNTKVNTLAAAITGGAGQNLTVSEADSLIINATIGDVTANGGDLLLTLRSGNLTGNGGMNADTGNIYLNASAGSIGLTGTLTANALDVRSLTNTTVTTNVSTITGVVSSGSLTVTEQDDISIGAANVTTFSGVSITAGSNKATGNINGVGFLSATAGNVLLSTPNGSVNLTANAGQVVGGVVTLNASGDSAINTNVSTLVANITGANNGLTVRELNALSIGSGNVVTKSGDISITTGGDLSRTGNITAGSKAPNSGADVILNINGATSGTGVITADTLNLTAVNSSTVNTSINTLIANITRDGQSLTVFEAAGLNIAGGNVTTVNGAISVNVATGDLTVTGGLTAGSGNVSLNVLTGGINATAGNISGNVLSVIAANASRLETAVNSVVANITGAGNTLNIVDIDSVSVGTGGLRTNNGTISVTAGNAGTGTLTIANPVNAGTGSVLLTNNNGAINGTANGLVTGNLLNVTVRDSSTLTTNVATLVGNITGSNQVLTVTETANGLQIGAANLVASGANGGINLTVANGSLTGNGAITAVSGPITIGVTNGNLATTGSINAGTGNLAFTVNGVVNLTGNNQVSGNVLSLTANGTSALNTAITSLVANITGAGNTLAVTDTNGLTIGGGGVVTNNGNITLTSGKDSAGDLLVSGPVTAGTKTV
jgi:filamentous hemagglutinin